MTPNENKLSRGSGRRKWQLVKAHYERERTSQGAQLPLAAASFRNIDNPICFILSNFHFLLSSVGCIGNYILDASAWKGED